MKKILAIMFACALALSLGLTAFASGAFVASPSAQRAPELVAAENASDACPAQIVITAYADRTSLDEAGAAAMAAAYAEIAAAADLGTMTPALAALADELGIPSTDLSVSDLFDVSYTNCEPHDEHGAFTVTVKPVSAENACGVLHYMDGEWELISCEVEDGEITFVADSFSPFAIVVHNGLPACFPWALVIAIIVAVLVAAVVVVVVLKKKKENTKEA